MSTLLLGIYIALILIRPMDWWGPLLGYPLVTAGAVAVFFVGLPSVLGRLPEVWRQIPQTKAALLLIMGGVMSWATAGWLDGMDLAFQTLGKLMFFFGLILTLVKDRKSFEVLLWTLLLCCCWLALHAILQHHRGYGFGNRAPLWRVRDRLTGDGVWQATAFGVFEDPNDLCLILVVAIPLFYVQYKITPNPIQKTLFLLGMALTAYGAWCTNSRGGIVGAFGMVVSYAIARAKGIRRYLLASLAVTMVTVLAPSRFGGGMIGKERSIQWGDGLAMFKAHPFFGVGFQDFTTYSSEGLVAHNTYVHALAELGLAGYLPFFLMIYLTMVQLRRIIRLKHLIAKEDHLLLTGIFAALSGYFTGMYFVSRQYQHILYVILGISITGVWVVAHRYDLGRLIFSPARRDVRRGLLWGLGSVALMWVTIRIANRIG